jgi:predicted glycosyltransferase involved in capsule biosynthesis
LKVGIVATAIKIEPWIIRRFVHEFKYNLANLYLIDDETVPCMNVFSITRCSNLGIERAINDGCDLIIKTDIDCIISEDVIRHAESWCSSTAGSVYRYWQLSDDGKVKKDPRCVGTCAMTAEAWQRCGMYDLDMQGYGYDDADIIYRAQDAGILLSVFNDPKVYHHEHAEKHNRDTINPVMREQNKQIGRDRMRRVHGENK